MKKCFLLLAALFVLLIGTVSVSAAPVKDMSSGSAYYKECIAYVDDVIELAKESKLGAISSYDEVTPEMIAVAREVRNLIADTSFPQNESEDYKYVQQYADAIIFSSISENLSFEFGRYYRGNIVRSVLRDNKETGGLLQGISAQEIP